MNQMIFEQYKIDGFPNHFYTMEITDKYNQKIEKWCRKLNKFANDLTFVMKLKRYFYIKYLNILDVITYDNKKY